MAVRGALAGLIRHGTFPLLAFGPGAITLGLIRPGSTGSLADDLPGLVGCGLLVVGSYVLLAVLERALPHRDDWNHPKNDVLPDVAYLLAIGPASAFLGGMIATLLVYLSHRAFPAMLRTELWPTSLPAAAQVFLACLVAEFGHYWMHRIGHEVPLFWRLHSIHHSARRLYWLNATRFHPLDLALIALFQVLPLHLLGIPAPIYLAYAVVSSCYGQLQHCNVDVDTSVWRWLFATPELHRWHHSQKPEEGDTNYGAILIAWDQLFRTRFWPGKALTEPVGIGSMPNFPEGLVDQMLAPLHWAALQEPEAASPSTPSDVAS